jgi:hypothetical protein
MLDSAALLRIEAIEITVGQGQDGAFAQNRTVPDSCFVRNGDSCLWPVPIRGGASVLRQQSSCYAEIGRWFCLTPGLRYGCHQVGEEMDARVNQASKESCNGK